jgi:hypothetical protein
MDWLAFLSNIAVTGILLYVFQKVIDERSSRRLAEFERNLQASLFEHQTRFEKLHEERVKITAKLYSLLVQAQRNLASLGSLIVPQDGEVKKEVLESARKSGDALSSYFDEHRLYLPESLCAELDRFQEIFHRTWMDYVLSQAYNHTVDYEAFMHMRRGFDTITDEIPKLRRVIEQEFREMLHADTEEAQGAQDAI